MPKPTMPEGSTYAGPMPCPIAARLRARIRAPKLLGGGGQQQQPPHHMVTTRTNTVGRVTDRAITTCWWVSLLHFLQAVPPSELEALHQSWTVRSADARDADAKPPPEVAATYVPERGTA